ncbi:MAG: carbon-nitrogen hydrolase family protein [Kiritimatiellia bacterium]
MKELTVRLVQLNSIPDPKQNLERLFAILEQAEPEDLIVLPEVFAVRGEHEDYVRSAEEIPGPILGTVADIARQRRSWLLAGSVIELSDQGLFNTAVLINRRGETVARYRKIHLFEARLDAGHVIREAETYRAGDEPVLAELEGWRCGLAICYDLRFPELFRRYAIQGAHLFLVPSNFTQRTGADHWEVLLRARAIENQCFVVAANQCGTNLRTGVESYGHSLAVDPWGRVLRDLETDVRSECVVLKPVLLDETRTRIPVLKHQRLL